MTNDDLFEKERLEQKKKRNEAIDRKRNLSCDVIGIVSLCEDVHVQRLNGCFLLSTITSHVMRSHDMIPLIGLASPPPPQN